MGLEDACAMSKQLEQPHTATQRPLSMASLTTKGGRRSSSTVVRSGGFQLLPV